MSDEHPTQPLPDPTAQWVLQGDAEPARQKRRRWPWLVALAAVVALLVGGWFAAEYIARGVVTDTIRTQIVGELGLPENHAVGIELPGQVLPQLITGKIDSLTLSSDDVSFGPLTGDVVVRATGVPIRGNEPIADASANVTLNEEQVRALLSSIDGFPADTVSLEAPHVAMTMELKLFALTVPVGVTLLPSAADGDVVLTPATLRVADAEVSAEVLVDQFGALARTVVRDWDICVAQYFPAGIVLSDVRVEGKSVIADLAIDGAIIHDTALQQNGACD